MIPGQTPGTTPDINQLIMNNQGPALIQRLMESLQQQQQQQLLAQKPVSQYYQLPTRSSENKQSSSTPNFLNGNNQDLQNQLLRLQQQPQQMQYMNYSNILQSNSGQSTSTDQLHSLIKSGYTQSLGAQQSQLLHPQAQQATRHSLQNWAQGLDSAGSVFQSTQSQHQTREIEQIQQHTPQTYQHSHPTLIQPPAPANSSQLLVDTGVSAFNLSPAVSQQSEEAIAIAAEKRATRDELENIESATKEVTKREEIVLRRREILKQQSEQVESDGESDEETVETAIWKKMWLENKKTITDRENRTPLHLKNVEVKERKHGPEDPPLLPGLGAIKLNHERIRPTLNKMIAEKEKSKHLEELNNRAEEAYKKWMSSVEEEQACTKKMNLDSKRRAIFETIFPEIKKNREEKARTQRVSLRVEGVIVQEEVEPESEMSAEERKRRNAAAIPPLAYSNEEQERDPFIEHETHVIVDAEKEHREFLEQRFSLWSDEDKELFKNRLSMVGKNFGNIAAYFTEKCTKDIILYYYLSKKRQPVTYKSMLPKKRRKTAKTYKAPPMPTNDDLNLYTQIEDTNTPSTSNAPIIPEVRCSVCAQLLDPAQNPSRPLTRYSKETYGLNYAPNKLADAHICTKCQEAQMAKKFGKSFGGRCLVKACMESGRKVKANKPLPPRWRQLNPHQKAFLLHDLGLPADANKTCANCLKRVVKRLEQMVNGELDQEVQAFGEEDTQIWEDDEVARLLQLVDGYGQDWEAIAEQLEGRSPEQCRIQFETFRGENEEEEVDENGDRADEDATIDEETQDVPEDSKLIIDEGIKVESAKEEAESPAPKELTADVAKLNLKADDVPEISEVKEVRPGGSITAGTPVRPPSVTVIEPTTNPIASTLSGTSSACATPQQHQEMQRRLLMESIGSAALSSAFGQMGSLQAQQQAQAHHQQVQAKAQQPTISQQHARAALVATAQHEQQKLIDTLANFTDNELHEFLRALPDPASRAMLQTALDLRRRDQQQQQQHQQQQAMMMQAVQQQQHQQQMQAMLAQAAQAQAQAAQLAQAQMQIGNYEAITLQLYQHNQVLAQKEEHYKQLLQQLKTQVSAHVNRRQKAQQDLAICEKKKLDCNAKIREFDAEDQHSQAQLINCHNQNNQLMLHEYVLLHNRMLTQDQLTLIQQQRRLIQAQINEIENQGKVRQHNRGSFQKQLEQLEAEMVTCRQTIQTSQIAEKEAKTKQIQYEAELTSTQNMIRTTNMQQNPMFMQKVLMNMRPDLQKQAAAQLSQSTPPTRSNTNEFMKAPELKGRSGTNVMDRVLTEEISAQQQAASSGQQNVEIMKRKSGLEAVILPTVNNFQSRHQVQSNLRRPMSPAIQNQAMRTMAGSVPVSVSIPTTAEMIMALNNQHQQQASPMPHMAQFTQSLLFPPQQKKTDVTAPSQQSAFTSAMPSPSTTVQVTPVITLASPSPPTAQPNITSMSSQLLINPVASAAMGAMGSPSLAGPRPFISIKQRTPEATAKSALSSPDAASQPQVLAFLPSLQTSVPIPAASSSQQPSAALLAAYANPPIVPKASSIPSHHLDANAMDITIPAMAPTPSSAITSPIGIASGLADKIEGRATAPIATPTSSSGCGSAEEEKGSPIRLGDENKPEFVFEPLSPEDSTESRMDEPERQPDPTGSANEVGRLFSTLNFDWNDDDMDSYDNLPIPEGILEGLGTMEPIRNEAINEFSDISDDES